VAAACVDFGGWIHRDKTLTPIKLSALLTMPRNPSFVWAMDSLAAAAEAGILDGARYIAQLFANKEDVRSLRQILRDARAGKWLTDRHFTALKIGLRTIGRSHLRRHREVLRPVKQSLRT
jgi:hypothetical protein